MTFGFFTLFWTLLNIAIILLSVTFLVYGIKAFRKYLKAHDNPSMPKNPEVD